MGKFFTFIRRTYSEYHNKYYYSGYVGFLNTDNICIPMSEAFIKTSLDNDEDCSFEKYYYKYNPQPKLDKMINFDYKIDYDDFYKSFRYSLQIPTSLFPINYKNSRLFGFNTNMCKPKDISLFKVIKETNKLKNELEKILK